MDKYLESSEYIDWENSEVLSLARKLAGNAHDQQEIARKCFEFVRDNIKHSWDHKLNPVTYKASDVLKYGTGYCYAKSHLLAALLRANNIPAGLCYQRLTITDIPPFCLHGLNAVFLKPFGWYRIDARGNKECRLNFVLQLRAWHSLSLLMVRQIYQKYGQSLYRS